LLKMIRVSGGCVRGWKSVTGNATWWQQGSTVDMFHYKIWNILPVNISNNSAFFSHSMSMFRKELWFKSQMGSQLFENLDAEVNINRAWEAVGGNTTNSAEDSLGHYKLKNHKPWSKELIHKRKQAKLQWLPDPSEISENNLRNIKNGASSHFMDKNISKTELISLQIKLRTRTLETCIEE
jgi:hypothetical protein